MPRQRIQHPAPNLGLGPAAQLQSAHLLRLPPLPNITPVIARSYSPGLGTRAGGFGRWTYAADKPPRACMTRTKEETYDVREAR